MDYAKPTDVVATMIESARNKLALAPRDLVIRGMLSGALLGTATSLAFTGALSTTVGKIVAIWLPIFTFFAQGFEHAVVNMFIIPTGMMLGAKVSLADWWFWNQIPVTLGNIVGGFVFTGLALYLTHRPAHLKPVFVPSVVQVPAE